MSVYDQFFMRNAISVARRGLGRTWPNPSVGAVLVSSETTPQVIARGWTAPGGRPHAERIAIEAADNQAKGAILYVTLEPCAHHGQTPPCAQAIIDAGITRVVCAMEDPDPRVAGKGFAMLEAAGIEVRRGVLEDEAADIVKGHVCRIVQGRPFVQLKIATGNDGLIPSGDGQPVWATGALARAHGHLLRARGDAILVGRGTVAADNPELTCRLPGMGNASPVRVVLSANGEINPRSRLLETLSTAPLWCMIATDCPLDAQYRLSKAGTDVIAVPRLSEQQFLDPAAVLAALAQRGITRVLLEGGATIAASFMENGLVDEIVHYQGTGPVGPAGIVPFAGQGIEDAVQTGWNKSGGMVFPDGDILNRYRRVQA